MVTSRRSHFGAGLAALAVLLAACRPGDQRPADQVLQLEESARFGSLDGALSLQAIQSITLSQGRGDSLLIIQTQVPAVLLLSSAGDSLGVLGRAGSGPGEFTAPVGAAIHQDTIWVPDVRGPVSRFDSSGRFIDQLGLRVPALGAFQYAPRFRAPLADGTILMEGVSNPIGREAREAVQALAYVRVSRAESVLDTIALLAVREGGYVLQFPDGTGVAGYLPAANPDVGAVDPEGRWIVVAAQDLNEDEGFGFTLKWILPSGDTLGTQHVRTDPVSAEYLRDRWIEDLTRSEGKPRGMIEAAAKEVPFPAHVAPAVRLFVDFEGRAWVKSPHPSPDSTRWYVVERDRGTIGSLSLPTEVELMAAKDGVVWGWTRGEYDEPYVLKLRNPS